MGKGTGLPPLTPRPVHKPTPEEVDRRGDEIFKKSIADLAQRLSERAREQPVDLRTENEKRRAALLAYELARKRRLKLIAGASGALVAVVCIAWFVVTISAPGPVATASAAPEPSPATRVETASLVPSAAPPVATAPAPAAPAPAAPMASPPTPPPSAPPPSTPQATTSPSPAPTPPAPPAAAAPAATPEVTASPPSSPPQPPPASTAASPPVSTAPASTAPASTAPSPASPPASAPPPAVADAPAAPAQPDTRPLQRAEIQEIQTKLYTFGFNPGPIDGAEGPMTKAAAMHYEADRGLPQSGEIDRALLETLRHDPAPQVAQAPPPPRRSPRAYAQRRSDDPFASLRAAGDRLGRWLESLSR
ncbi:peptidoglycan-binding domain-containing protein [Enhydrobacter sp.]|jgi:hypothetical protein|uniref:peptidoglycan-binding domain-containing protein n=1 Tax=Enhydrobacter sp. TaxID=1894999 RepID=UPI00262950F1|nr:peptidoglycan-binding domain-containing protein [Enhydrobacter sp.]